MNFLLIAYKITEDKTPDSFQANEKDLNDKLKNLFQSYEIVTVQKEKIIDIICFNRIIGLRGDYSSYNDKYTIPETEVPEKLKELTKIFPTIIVRESLTEN